MKNVELVGRENEQELLVKALSSKEAEMVAVIGRRRVGKTFLIKSVYDKHIVFQMSGIQHATGERQLENFSYQLSISAQREEPIETPPNWFRAFTKLILLMGKKRKISYIV